MAYVHYYAAAQRQVVPYSNVGKAVQYVERQEFLADGSYDERGGFAGAVEYAADCEKDYKLLSDYLSTEGTMNREMQDY